jgi:hypothetical protein
MREETNILLHAYETTSKFRVNCQGCVSLTRYALQVPAMIEHDQWPAKHLHPTYAGNVPWSILRNEVWEFPMEKGKACMEALVCQATHVAGCAVPYLLLGRKFIIWSEAHVPDGGKPGCTQSARPFSEPTTPF